MADLSGITAVRPTANTILRTVQYGATVAIGQVVVRSDTKYLLSDANASAALAAGAAIKRATNTAAMRADLIIWHLAQGI
jgi:hypothetical protein